MRYCESPYFYQRRKAREVVIGDPARGGVIIGGLCGAFAGSLLAGRIAQRPLRVGLLLVLIVLGCQLALHGYSLNPALKVHAAGRVPR